MKDIYKQYSMTDLLATRKAVMASITRAQNPRVKKPTGSLKTRLAVIDAEIASRR